MEANDISGRAVAAYVGVREQTVSEWRRGSYRPHGDALNRLAEILKVAPETLRQDDGIAVREAAATYSAPLDPVQRIVAQAQRDQVQFLQDFAAQILEAGAAVIRRMAKPVDAPGWVRSAELDGDDTVVDTIKEAAAARVDPTETATG